MSSRYIFILFTVLISCLGINNIIAQELDIEAQHDSAYIKNQLNLMLFQYCDSGDVDAVKQLLRYGATPDIANEYGVTPLMYAVQSGSYELVELLLNLNVDVNKKPFDGNTALHAALRSGNDSISELLLKHDADVNIQNKLGLAPLHYSAWYGMPYITDLLLYYGANVDVVDKNENTPLMLSAYNGTLLSARLLLERNANPNIVNQKGISPLMLAAQFNDTAFVGLLYDYGADINLVDNVGANALVYAIRASAVDAIGFLVNLGAAEKSLAKSYYQIAAETDFPNLRHALDTLGLKEKITPSLGDVLVGSGLIFNRYEFLWGFHLGLTEQVSKLNFSLGYWYRPTPIATLEYKDMAIYQFREKRQVFELRVNRLTSLSAFRRSNFGIYYGGNVGVVFRNFRGTENDPSTSISPGVNAGFYWGSQTTKAFAGWEFTSLKTPDACQHRVGVSINFFIPVSKTRYTKTHINYVD